MPSLLIPVAVLLASGLLSLVAGKRSRAASAVGAAGAVAGCGLALVQAAEVLLGGQVLSLRAAWDVPLGSFSLVLDPLAAVFAGAIALVSGLAAVYGNLYLRHYEDRKNLGVSWFFFNLLAASMLLVVMARNGVLFLVCWEVMSLASFFLVLFEAERDGVCRAAWTYLVATHLGTASLLALFAFLGRDAGSLDFDLFHATPDVANVAFLLALVGFGTKAGFLPLHVWLPEAHPAAPSHVSAVMSGVMIKTGIYGLARTLTFLGPPPSWWGWVLVGVGAASGVLGVLFALAQHDLKRLLAYHSVENIGIITMGLGVGLLGVSYGSPAMAALGFAGSLLHVVNHAVFKSLLFLGAGAVRHATGTLEIDHLGGLLKRMPQTGLTFLVGSAAICGLPPLNGFVSEFLIYLGAFQGLVNVAKPAAEWPVASLVVIAALATIGGLAAACFTKAFGVIFLGEPRSDQARHAHEVGFAMRGPMLVLAALCVAIGLAGAAVLRLIEPAVETMAPRGMAIELADKLSDAGALLAVVASVALFLLALAAFLLAVRRKLLAGREVGQTGTWDCGYAAPTARMQYTASSFAQPTTSLFRRFLRTRHELEAPQGLFPGRASLRTETPDPLREEFYRPVFLAVAWVASRLRWLQQGRIQLYILYIAITLVVLLVWKLN
ncbi:MAG: proton-conducting transporter transmembrane domain-containing protein [Pirellulales bacterium]